MKHSRWIAPIAAVVVAASAGTAVTALQAAAHGALKPRTAAQLLVDVQQAQIHALSGTIVETADLGLPALPDSMTGNAGPASMLSGSHTVRVWYDGAKRFRLSLQDQSGETDLIRNATSLWTWSSADRSATHRTLGKDASTALDHHGAGMAGTGMTPQLAAATALQAIDPSTKVESDGTGVVAGRSAYQLALVPRSADTLVGKVLIAIDSETHVPLRVAVYPKGVANPAVDVAFTSFDPTAPPASVFAFNPPPGTTVSQQSGSSFPSRKELGSAHTTRHQLSTANAAAQEAMKVVGKDWSTVVVAHVPTMGTQGQKPSSTMAQLQGYLQSFPTVSGSWGKGHLFSGSLFSVLVTDDGRVAAGAVPAQQLYDALSAAK